GSEATARTVAAAYAHVPSADSHHGEDETSAPHCDSRQSASQRSTRCQPLAYVSSDRRLSCRHEHYFRRSEGHTGSRHEGVIRVECEDEFSAIVLPIYRAERGDAG